MFDCMVDDLKRDPPVSTDGNAPCASTVPGKLVHAPASRALYLAQVSPQDQYGDNFAYSLDKIRTEPLAVIAWGRAAFLKRSLVVEQHAQVEHGSRR